MTLVVVSASAGAAVAAVLRAAAAADRVRAASERRIRQDVAFYGAMNANRPRVGSIVPESRDLDMIDDVEPSPVVEYDLEPIAEWARRVIRAYAEALRDLAAAFERSL